MPREYDEDLERLETIQQEEEPISESPPSDIIAFNELRSCADLFRLSETNQLEIQPDYQRDVVWAPATQTTFIDSLVKQLPIPSMCISWDAKTDKRQMVDGLQRMSSIIEFLKNDSKWRLSNVQGIDPRLSGQSIESIRKNILRLFQKWRTQPYR